MNFSFWPFLWFGLPGRLLRGGDGNTVSETMLRACNYPADHEDSLALNLIQIHHVHLRQDFSAISSCSCPLQLRGFACCRRTWFKLQLQTDKRLGHECTALLRWSDLIVYVALKFSILWVLSSPELCMPTYHFSALWWNISHPVLLFLRVFVSLVFLLLQNSLVFLSIFCLFFQGFKGFERWENPCCFGGFPWCFWRDQGEALQKKAGARARFRCSALTCSRLCPALACSLRV